jgi:aryl-alcohol dehydrogenase-like predicted oxidoreductase
VQSEDGKSRLDNSEMQQFIGNRERANRVVDTLKTVAKEAGHSPAQIALTWLRQRPQPAIPIVGARKLEQLVANLAIVDLRLSNEHLRVLNEASAIELGFPHDMLEKPRPQALAFGGMRPLIEA